MNVKMPIYPQFIVAIIVQKNIYFKFGKGMTVHVPQEMAKILGIDFKKDDVESNLPFVK